MNSDLIERAKQYLKQAAPHIRKREHYQIIEDLITALTPVTDEEAQRIVASVRESFCPEGKGCGVMNYCLCAIAEEAADLIERLARANIYLVGKRVEMQQRIEELENNTDVHELQIRHDEVWNEAAKYKARAERAEQQLDEITEKAGKYGLIDKASIDRIRAMGEE